jgi:aldose 1-epimerase
MAINRKLWGRTPDGKAIYKYTLTNASGASVVLGSVGAAIVSVNVPDKNGKLGDVALVDGKTYTVPVNNGPNHLHGGPDGFSERVWESRKRKGGVEFKYVSADGEMGYPGQVVVVARYEWSEENELRLTFSAKSDKKTVINLTNHAYFNLNCGGSILRQFLKLNCSEYLPTDPGLIPLGDPAPVAGTPMDFLNGKTLGRDIKKDFPALNYGKGYDACWVIDGYRKGQLQEAAELWSNHSGRTLKVFTTQPGIQVYTGNWLGGCPVGKRGRIYHDYEGVALEAQHFPDSPNQPAYPSTVLQPGKTYHEAIIFAFGVKK